jgi:hypothetical protein
MRQDRVDASDSADMTTGVIPRRTPDMPHHNPKANHK